MTDRANRGSDICGIATKSWPASEFITSSDRRPRPPRRPPVIRLYADFVSSRCTNNRYGAGRRRCLPSDPPCAIDRPAAPLRDRDASPARLSVSHTRRDTMTINVGDRIPSVTLKQLTSEGVKEFTTDEIFRGKRVVLIAVPGAFTPACSQRHLPGYVDKATDIKAKGIDEIACVAVNDAFVMGAWGRDQKAEGKVRMLADGSGDFTRALGLELDLSKGGLGMRSKRYSMLVDDGVVKSLNVEQQPGQVDLSGAEAMLKAL